MVCMIIQARLGSTRLPKKILMKVNGRPLLSCMIERVKRAGKVDRIVIAATASHLDSQVETFCKDENVECFRGNEEDVLDRYYNCAQQIGAKVIVRLTSDCPLIDPAVIDEVVNCYLENSFKYDFVANTVPPPGTYPDGMDVEVFSFDLMEKAWKNAKKPSEREHVTFYFWKNPDLFKVYRYDLKTDLSKYRLTIDYEEDYLLIKKIIEHFHDDKLLFTMEDIIAFLKSNPDIAEINQHIERNVGWQKSFRKDEENYESK